MDIVYTPLSMEDSEAFFLLAGNERTAATMRFDCPHTRQESDRILEGYLARENRTFALRSEAEGELWGVFAFKAKPNSDTADLSQMLLPERWGQGLGGRVLRDMAELAKREHWYKALEGYVLETNTASRRMAESVGFRVKERVRFSGMTEDLVIYYLEL